MPSFVAASITVAPLSTVTALPSISRLMGIQSAAIWCATVFESGCCSGVLAARLHVAALVVDVVLELAPEHLHEGARGHGHRVAEGTDGAALDVVREVEQQVEVFHAALAMLDAIE